MLKYEDGFEDGMAAALEYISHLKKQKNAVPDLHASNVPASSRPDLCGGNAGILFPRNIEAVPPGARRDVPALALPPDAQGR